MDDVLRRLGQQRRMVQNGSSEWNASTSLQLNGSLDSFSRGGYQAAPDSLGFGTFKSAGARPTVESENQSAVCSECGMVIRKLTNLPVHMRRHIGYKPFICFQCPYSGYDEDDIRRHLSRAHGNSAYNTDVRFSPNSDLEHSVEEMIARSRTVASSSPTGQAEGEPGINSKSLIEKLLSGYSAPSSPVTCNFCGASVNSSPTSIVQHLKGHLEFPGYCCPLCRASSVVWVDFVAHLEQAHSREPRVTLWSQESRNFLPDAIVSLASLAFTGPNQPLLPCFYCSSQVKWSELKEHAFLEAGLKAWRCNTCNQGFVEVNNLLKHHKEFHRNKGSASAFFSFLSECCWDVKSESGITAVEKAFPFLATESMDSIQAQTECVVSSPLGSGLPPSRSTTTSVDESAKKAMIECQLCCAQISRNMSCLIAHAKVHLAYKPLKCEYCSFRHFAMSKIRRHNTRVHSNRPVKVSYHPVSDIGRQIKQMKLRCFGAQASSTVWGMPVIQNGDLGDNDNDSLLDSVLVDEEEDSLDNSGPIPVMVNSPLPSSDHLLTTSDDSPSALPVSSVNSAVLQQNSSVSGSNVSKLLQQLMCDSSDPTGIPIGLSNYADMGESQASGFLTVKSPDPDPGLYTSRSSSAAGETYDLTGMGKKVCVMCNTFIANNPSSFDNHACKHLDYKPYYCFYCQYQSYIRGKVTRHIQQVHSGLAVRINHRPIPGIKDKIQAIKLKCFPFLANGSDSGGPDCSLSPGKNAPCVTPSVNETRCKLCEAPVLALESSMDEHLQIHIPVKYYHCPVCTYQTTYLIRAKQHVHSAHPTSQETRILCCPTRRTERIAVSENKMLRGFSLV